MAANAVGCVSCTSDGGDWAIPAALKRVDRQMKAGTEPPGRLTPISVILTVSRTDRMTTMAVWIEPVTWTASTWCWSR